MEPASRNLPGKMHTLVLILAGLFTGITTYPLDGFEAFHTGGNSYLKLWIWPKDIGPRKEPIDDVLLNDHVIKLPSKFVFIFVSLCYSEVSSEIFLIKRMEIMQGLNTIQTPEYFIVTTVV